MYTGWGLSRASNNGEFFTFNSYDSIKLLYFCKIASFQAPIILSLSTVIGLGINLFSDLFTVLISCNNIPT